MFEFNSDDEQEPRNKAKRKKCRVQTSSFEYDELDDWDAEHYGYEDDYVSSNAVVSTYPLSI